MFGSSVFYGGGDYRGQGEVESILGAIVLLTGYGTENCGVSVPGTVVVTSFRNTKVLVLTVVFTVFVL